MPQEPADPAPEGAMRPQPYRRFAEVYDTMGADRHSRRMVTYTESIFRRFGIRPRTGLDLCCGTGSAIAAFCDIGVAMAGLDQSAHMLAVASRKLRGRKVRLYQKTLPRFRILETGLTPKGRRFDFVTCYYDSLNYLPRLSDLKEAFRSVRRHLYPDGWFIFDLNTPMALKTIWDGQVFAGAQTDLAWVWKNSFDEHSNLATCHCVFFVKGRKAWDRFEETHIEYAWDTSLVAQALRQSGFKVKGVYRCFSFEKVTIKTTRVCFVAQRV